MSVGLGGNWQKSTFFPPENKVIHNPKGGRFRWQMSVGLGGNWQKAAFLVPKNKVIHRPTR